MFRSRRCRRSSKNIRFQMRANNRRHTDYRDRFGPREAVYQIAVNSSRPSPS